MIASITELNLKNFWCFLQFIPLAVRSKMQADKAPGILSSRVASQGILTQRTLTVWENEESLKAYVRSGPHLQAMRAFPRISMVSYTAHFPVTAIPDWQEALEYLRAHGKAHG